jgi:hypothetical protein
MRVSSYQMKHVQAARQSGRYITVMFNGAVAHPLVTEISMGTMQDWSPRVKNGQLVGFRRG